MKEIAKHANFVGVKECAGNERIQHYESQGIACWSGNDDQAFEARHEYGAHGVISVAGNLLPKAMRKLMDDPKADQLNDSLQNMFNWLFGAPNPIPLNTILSMAGLCGANFRLPYVPYNKEKRKEGLSLLKLLKDESISDRIKLLKDNDFSLI